MRLQSRDALRHRWHDHERPVLTSSADLTTPGGAASITASCPRPGLAVVVMGGQIDLAAVDAVEEVFAAGGCAAVIIDVGAVSFIDGAGLRSLVAAARAAAAVGGCLVLRGPPPVLVCLITWCHLTQQLPVQAAHTRRCGPGRRRWAACAGHGAGR